MATKKRGIDISLYQGNPDFSKVKSAVDYVIIRAGYGKYSYQKDSRFERNYSECKKYGIPVGVYWFSYATSEAEAKQEAKACLEVIKGKTFEYPIYFDVEGKALTNKATVSACCKAFCGTLEAAGYFTGIYISRSPAQTMLDSICTSKYALWLAEYNSKLNWTGDVGAWQYSSTGVIPGITGHVDMDECYIDYPTLIKNGGYNGFEKPKVTETNKVLDNAGFKLNDATLGVYAYKQMLIEAHNKGYVSAQVKNDAGFGKGTEQMTNELLKRFGYKQNGIAGAGLINKLGELLRK